MAVQRCEPAGLWSAAAFGESQLLPQLSFKIGQLFIVLPIELFDRIGHATEEFLARPDTSQQLPSGQPGLYTGLYPGLMTFLDPLFCDCWHQCLPVAGQSILERLQQNIFRHSVRTADEVVQD